MKIDLLEQQPQSATYPLYNESMTDCIGRLEADHNGYLKADNDELNKDRCSFEQFDDEDGAEKFRVSY